jgi:hypothetical protein
MRRYLTVPNAAARAEQEAAELKAAATESSTETGTIKYCAVIEIRGDY